MCTLRFKEPQQSQKDLNKKRNNNKRNKMTCNSERSKQINFTRTNNEHNKRTTHNN